MDVLCALDGDILEGPVWDARDGSLLLVDLVGQAIRLEFVTSAVTKWTVGEHVSLFLPRERGGYVSAAGDRIVLGAPLGPPAETVRPVGVRFNDGACDAHGRLWIGTMEATAVPAAGALYRIDADLTWREELTDVTISNGLGWSADNRSMYYIDSTTKRIDRFDYDLDDGSLGDRHAFVDTAGYQGMPDGLAVDAEDCVWVAFYRGAALRRFAPDGRCVDEILVPGVVPTSVGFAGNDLSTLVMTTRGRTPVGDGRFTGGHLYACSVNTPGRPTTSFAG